MSFVRSFLGRDIASMASLARKRGCSETHIQNLLKRSRDCFIQTTPWPESSHGSLIIIADAVVEFIEGKWHTVYLMLVRPVRGTEAAILSPLIAPGTETPEGWSSAMHTIPESIKTRIEAIVCDGHNGLIREAKIHRWVIQRCHFHLIARLRTRLSWSVPGNRIKAEIIFSNLYAVLQGKDPATIRRSLMALDAKRKDSTSKETRRILSGFMTNFQDYRSYLIHPELHLPTTNNTAESLGSSIADLKQRLRGFPTKKSFESWIIALLKFKKRVACNGFHQPNIVG